MDVLQTLGMNTSAKGSGAKDVLVEDVDWETIFDSSLDSFPNSTHVVEVQDPEILEPEDLTIVSDEAELTEAQSGEVLNEEATMKSELPVAVSVQEYTTTFETRPSLTVQAPQDVEETESLDSAQTARKPHALNAEDVIDVAIRASSPNVALSKMVSEVEIKPVEAKSSIPVQIEESTLREAPLAKVKEHKLFDQIEPPLNRAEKRSVIEKAVIEKSDTIVRSDALPRVSLVQSRNIEKDVDPETKIPRHSKVTTPDFQRVVGAENKEVPIIERLLPSVAGVDPRVIPSESTIKLGELNVSSQISQPILSSQITATIPTPSTSVTVRDQPILTQVSQAIEAADSGKVELRLDPAELGKVRITMSARDGFMHATIMAERPETLELLRRNSDSLDMTFAEQGFDQSQLSFEQFAEDDKSDGQSEEGLSFDLAGAVEEKTPPAILSQISGGLDIKL